MIMNIPHMKCPEKIGRIDPDKTEHKLTRYLEGILIADGYRKKGYTAELLSECEKWAKEKGCSEFASDCELVNEESLKFHMALGFEEANRIICFRKDI